MKEIIDQVTQYNSRFKLMKNIATPGRTIGMLKVKSIYSLVKGPAKDTLQIYLYTPDPLLRESED